MSDEIRVLRLMTRANLGGPARQMQALAAHLPAQGIAQLWCFGTTGPDETELSGLDPSASEAASASARASGSACVRLPDFGRSMDPGGDMLTLRALMRLVKSFEPQILHTHMAKAGVLGVALAARTGLPLVHSFHGHVLRDYYGPRRSEGLRRVERALCKRRARIHCISESCAQELVDLGLFGREDCVVIPSILDPLSFEPATGRDEARQLLGIDPAEWALVWVGRLVPVKDPALLIETLGHLTALSPDRELRLHVFGSGPLEPELRQAARTLPLVLHGPRPDLPRLLGAFDLMLSTSHREGFPLSVLESLAQGISAIGPEVPGLIDLEGPGLSLHPRDPAALARACIAPTTVPPSRSQALREHHHPARLACHYAELYRNLLL